MKNRSFFEAITEDNTYLPLVQDVLNRHLIEWLLTKCRIMPNTVAIEGTECTGKTTIMQELLGVKWEKYATDFFPYHHIINTKEPGMIPHVKKMREFYSDVDMDITEKTPALIKLFVQDRKEHVEFIRNNPKTLFISDRSFYSTLIYQGGLHGRMEDVIKFSNLVSKLHDEEVIYLPQDIFILRFPDYKLKGEKNSLGIRFDGKEELHRRLNVRANGRDCYDDVDRILALNGLYKCVEKNFEAGGMSEYMDMMTIVNEYGEEFRIHILDAFDAIPNNVGYIIHKIMEPRII